MADIEISQFIAGADNFCVLLHDTSAKTTISIDAPHAKTIQAELDKRGWTLTHILTTHHHGDHTAGNLALKAASGCTIIGPAGESHKIPGLDRTVREGDTVEIGSSRFRVIETPGHTLGHVIYHEPRLGLAFVGDTLFAMGCGRVIEGDYPMMWQSLEKIAALPEETMLYCGHDYTEANARFALTIEPGNGALQVRAREAAMGHSLVPTRLSDELATNPFLRANAAPIRKFLGLETSPAWKVFGEIRDRKNRS